MDIEDLLPDGKWFTDEEYVVRCPWLDHPTHNHCYINVVKQKFICHFCGERGWLKRLLQEYKVVGEIEPRDEVVEREEAGRIDFSQFEKVTDGGGLMNQLAFSYLKDRGLSSEEIKAYDIRYSNEGRFYGRVLLPIYEDGKLVHFTGRSFIKSVKPKYLFPYKGETLLTTSGAIFGYDEAVNSPLSRMVIVEGIFDAMAINRMNWKGRIRGLAILSSHISAGQLHKLLLLPKKDLYIICLDPDVHEKTIALAKTLSEEYERKNVKVVLLPEGDPASIPENKFIKFLDGAVPYSFNLELEIMTPNSGRC